jgi:hypothetical protein
MPDGFDLISIGVLMMASRALLCSLMSIALAGALPAWQAAQTAGGGTPPLSVEEVVKLSQNGLPEELIITKIKKNARAFDLSTEELLELKKSGVSDNVVRYLLDPSQPYAPPPPPPPAPTPDPSSSPPKPSPPEKQYPEDAFASKVPPEPGLYRFPSDTPAKIELKMLLGEKQGAGLGKVVLKKGKTIGYLVGPASKTRVPNPAPIFYLRLPEGKAIEEVVLVALEAKKDRRDIELGSGQKVEFKAPAMRQFDSLEVGPKLFRITCGKLGKGEYLFFLVGSPEPAKGNYGKVYDFGIDDPPHR